MDFELTQPSIFPNGTTVKAYAAASVPDRTAAPTGPSVAEGVVAEDAVTLTGLSADQSYYAGAKIGEVWRYVHFTPGTPGVDVILDADGDETVTGDWTFGGALATGNVEINGELNHDGTKVGFYGAAPVAQPDLKAPAEVTAKEIGEALVALGLIK